MAPLRKALLAMLLMIPGNGQAQKPEGATTIKLRRLAESGNAEATYHLGMAHHVGLGAARDKRQALAEFRKAADLGDPLAAYKLGCYYDGQGDGLVKDDPALALQYKLIAAHAGYALAQQDVASLYARKGEFETARDWLNKAADQGWGDALAGMASVHNGKNGLPRDPVIMHAYFQLFLARNDGSSEAQRQWLADLEKEMSADERDRADAIVRDFKPVPTALTVKGLSGSEAAEKLVASLP